MRRTLTAAEDLLEPSTELIARLSAEHDFSPGETTGRHRHSPDAVVTRPVPATRLAGIRRLAPVAVGAIVMLVATLVLTTVRSPAAPAAPALVDQSSVTSPAADQSSVASPATDPATVQPAVPTRAATPTPLPSTSLAAVANPKPAALPAAAKPSIAAARAPAAAGGGTQAAIAQGWALATSDEFAGTALSDHWSPYDGAGNGGDGIRSPDAITVQNGIMTIRGDSKGTTGGMAWTDDQQFGKWEVRARFPKGDDQYHPVLLLWPQGEWPKGGEVDFAETTSASPDVDFFLHYSASNKQKSADKTLDLTQWHNYAVEWAAGRITGYIDGQQWFQSADSSTLPPGKMHLAIQLDYFPDGGSPKPTEMDVDYVRIYK